jgi:hypothetical protein
LYDSPDILWGNKDMIFEDDYYRLIVDKKSDLTMINIGNKHLYGRDNTLDIAQKIEFYPISKEINEKLFEYTYDGQKRYTGIYEYDSHALYGMTVDEFNQENLLDSKKIMNIDDNGFLFIMDEWGYNDTRFKLLTKNDITIIFRHEPGSGSFAVCISFSENAIFYEMIYRRFVQNEEIESGFKVKYKIKE